MTMVSVPMGPACHSRQRRPFHKQLAHLLLASFSKMSASTLLPQGCARILLTEP